MLNATRLNVLREVVSSGSFSAAADALSYSQSAVSQAIATLEGEVGTTLIERDRGGVRPTAAGAALVTHAEGILGRMEAAETELAAIAGGEAGRLRIASFPSAGATLVPQAIAAFSAGHPGVEVTLAEGERRKSRHGCAAASSTSPCSTNSRGSANASQPASAASSCSRIRFT